MANVLYTYGHLIFVTVWQNAPLLLRGFGSNSFIILSHNELPGLMHDLYHTSY